MVEVISDTTQVARKEYYDSSAESIQEFMRQIRRNEFKMTFAELRAIAKLKANKWKILKGQTYRRQRCKYDGYLYTFKSLPEIIKICFDYELFPEL